MHPQQAHVIPVKLHDEVIFKDVIQTQRDSRTKAFFQDDSILTVGENSRIEINEYIYKPEDNVRKAVVTLLEGQVRALVSKVFKANGSRFEVHTPSAVAAARGTYFTVWAENGQSGIINIGETGRVDFTSGGTTVAVDPGYFSVASNGQAPSAPVKHHFGEDRHVATTKPAEDEASADAHLSVTLENMSPQQGEILGLAQALAAVERTKLGDSLLAELPSQVLQAMNVDTHLVTTLITLAGATTQSAEGILGSTVRATGGINVIAQVGGDGAGGNTSLASVSAGVGSTGITATVGPVNAGPVNLGPVSVGPISTAPSSVGPVNVGPVSVGPVAISPISTAPISVGPVSVGPIAVAPVTVAPVVVAPAVSLPTITVPLPLPVAPMTVGPVSVVPTTPVLPVTPPAVINGALNLLGH
jgi:hypothetical protein